MKLKTLIIILAAIFLILGITSIILFLNRSHPENYFSQNGDIVFSGKIQNERIPPELELGDNWYWIYFDKPFLLENNSSGKPINVDKLQVIFPTGETQSDIDKYINKEVEVTGTLTWGYAESSVIQIKSVKFKK